VHLGDTLHVEGTIFPPATVGGVGLARMDLPEKIPVSEANKRRSYPVPQPYQMYWPAGYQTPIVVRVDLDRSTLIVDPPAGLLDEDEPEPAA